MKRAQSALSLKSIAQSINKSIQQHTKHKKVPSLLPSSRSQSYLFQKESQKEKEDKLSKDQRQNRIFILEKQIALLQRELDSSKSSIRNYSKELSEYEKTNDSIQELQYKIALQKQKAQQKRNQVFMLKEEVLSFIFNSEERVAQKEYFEQLIDTYQRQYEEESQRVMELIRLEQAIARKQKQVQQLDYQISVNIKKIEQWKEEIDFDLNEHKIKNNLKISRIQLIQFQDACDIHCTQYGLRKLRELCCSFFKSYAKKNGIGIQEAQEGVDIYICKKGLVEEFSEFVKQRIAYNRPFCSQIDKFLDAMLKIEAIYGKNSNKANKKLHNIQIQEIGRLEQLKNQKIGSINQIKAKMQSIKAKIDSLFGEQSLAVIEYLRERSNKYDLKQIKATLKQNKKLQNTRIIKVRQAYQSIHHLEKTIIKDSQSQIQAKNHLEIYSISSEIGCHSQNLAQLLQQMAKFKKAKDSIENLISNAISKWRQRDQNKAKLKQLYDQLAQTKHSKTYCFSKNLNDSIKKEDKKPNESLLNDSNRFKNLSRKESLSSLHQSKSILSLNNPYKKIMDRQIQAYQPIIEDCQMILSKKLNSKEQYKPFSVYDLEQSKVLRDSNQNVFMKKTKVLKANQKENYAESRTLSKHNSKALTQTKYSISAKQSMNFQSKNKGKLTESQRLSLSKLLLSKFNR